MAFMALLGWLLVIGAICFFQWLGRLLAAIQVAKANATGIKPWEKKK